MSYCHVSAQIAKHCSNDGEVFCQECGENMYLIADNSTIVRCANDSCASELDMQPDEPDFDSWDDY